MDLNKRFYIYERMKDTLHSLHVYCKTANDSEMLAKGIASLLSPPIQIFHLQGQYLRSNEGEQLAKVLETGQMLLFLCQGEFSLPAEFADGWVQYAEMPRHATISIGRHINFQPNPTLTPGFLIVVHVSPGRSPKPYRATQCPLSAEEVGILETKGKALPSSINRIGVSSQVSVSSITMKDLCFLHAKDPKGTKRLLLGDLLEKNKETSWTWTDLQELLLHGRSYLSWLDRLHQQGLIDDEKWSYGQAAFDYLNQRKQDAPLAYGVPVYAGIYDAIWAHDFLDVQQRYIFRGQSNIRWRQDCTLLRTEHGSLNVETLAKRLRLTQAFIDELKRCQHELFDTELSDEEYLAIAQHYGFPTPLLDYTRSLRIAAFFATLGAAKLKTGEELIGVIYYTDLEPQRVEDAYIGQFSLLQEARINLGRLRVIEPSIPESDNRIARQQGVFLGGYQVRDLQNASIDRIHFRQKPGEVFEDPSLNITKEYLLPDRSPIAQIAAKMKEQSKTPTFYPTIHPLIGATHVPETSLIGSRGLHLFAQVREAGSFFARLRDHVEQLDNKDLAEELGYIFKSYFQESHALADVGDLPTDNDDQRPLDPFENAISQLARSCRMDDKKLWDGIEELLPREVDYQAASKAQEWRPLEPSRDNERIALACALYLAGWEHLKQVGGQFARGVTAKAELVLENAWDEPPALADAT
jgi:hypothetical protein